jgi:hypothetical protein
MRIAFALMVTFGCASAQLSTGISGSLDSSPKGAATSVESFWVPDPLPMVTHPPVTTMRVSPTTTTTTTLAVFLSATLSELVDQYFDPADRAWALRVAFCESSAQPSDTYSTAYHPDSGATGWFQHLPKFWAERSTKAGVPNSDMEDSENNVLVAAWLLYETPQGKGHWNESKHCWG